MKKKIILVALVIALLVFAVVVLCDTPRLDDSGVMGNYNCLENIFG